jgi:hypothetical protein
MTTAESTLAVIGRLGRAQLEQNLRRAARLMGRSRPELLALNDIGYPDTSTALEAASLLRAQAPSVLAAHCYRTYLFGAALGTRDGLDWDAELLFISAMLHDLVRRVRNGFTVKYWDNHACEVHRWHCVMVTGRRWCR